MTKTNNNATKRYNVSCTPANVDGKHVDGKQCNCPSAHNKDTVETRSTKPARTYAYYSNVLRTPFSSVEELEKAEDAYFAEQKAKEDKAAQKKADAQKVEEAFKALNAARKEYKEKLTQLTQEYSDALVDLKKAFDLGKKDIHDHLAAAEDTYAKALKEFTAKYDNYHVTLKDGDFETTISGSTNVNNVPKDTVKTTASKEVTKETPKVTTNVEDLFNLLFSF